MPLVELSEIKEFSRFFCLETWDVVGEVGDRKRFPESETKARLGGNGFLATLLLHFLQDNIWPGSNHTVHYRRCLKMRASVRALRNRQVLLFRDRDAMPKLPTHLGEGEISRDTGCYEISREAIA